MRTSLQQIAEACGILPGSLYHHFTSKEAIIVELIERYRADLDDIAKRSLDDLQAPGPVSAKIMALSAAIAACGARHRAAVLQSFYEPPSGAGDRLVRVARLTPTAIEAAMLETLRAGRASGYVRSGIDLDTLAERLCQTMLYISLGVFRDVRGADELPAIRCRIMLEGVAVHPPTDAELDRSNAFRAAQQVVDSWDEVAQDEDGRLARLRAVARAEFGRPLVNSLLTLGVAVGLSVGDTTLGTTVGNLGFEKVEFPRPVFHGDTIYAETEVVDKRASRTRPQWGIVTFEHRARNQDGEIIMRARRQAMMRKQAEGAPA